MSSPAPALWTDDCPPDTCSFSPPPLGPETISPTYDYESPPPDISALPPTYDYATPPSPPPDISPPPPPGPESYFAPSPAPTSSPQVQSPLPPDISPPPSPGPVRDSAPSPEPTSSLQINLPTSPPPPPPTITRPPPPILKTSSPSSGTSTGMITGITIGSAVITLAVVAILFLKWKKRKRGNDHVPQASHNDHPVQKRPPNAPAPVDHFVAIPQKHPAQPAYISCSGGTAVRQISPAKKLSLSTTSFTYEELSVATDGFSTANLLGKGGFGYVHKGVLQFGQEVAVKQLNTGSAMEEGEFLAEIEIISRVHHEHLVSLVGYCITGSERMLVYEFVQNKTLNFHLHGKGRPTIDWATRWKIALGAVKGLAYLHDCHPKIIHSDIKASHILLDFNFEAKIADFGLANFYSHTSTRAVGSFGYLAPEYAYSGKLTEKSDVFSFGVVLLELITGRNAVDTIQPGTDDSLIGWARPLLENGQFDALVDPQIQMDYKQTEMARIVACAAACVRHSANKRPRMSLVARALEGNLSLSDLNEPEDTYGSDPGIPQYDVDMKKFTKPVLRTRKPGPCDLYRGPSSSGEAQQTREMEMNTLKKAGRGGI